jgi:hypothetical protein
MIYLQNQLDEFLHACSTYCAIFEFYYREPDYLHTSIVSQLDLQLSIILLQINLYILHLVRLITTPPDLSTSLNLLS